MSRTGKSSYDRRKKGINKLPVFNEGVDEFLLEDVLRNEQYGDTWNTRSNPNQQYLESIFEN
jgi:hypothetical protein